MKNTAIFSIGLRPGSMKATNCIMAETPKGGKIMIPICYFKGSKASLRKQVTEAVEAIFDSFDKE